MTMITMIMIMILIKGDQVLHQVAAKHEADGQRQVKE